jgi:16S rRNA (guanine(966)-N(2))-methyltransferase RsmD
MRIVAGETKGARLLVPSGTEVRPTSDRVREAVFSSLGTSVRGARVLDLFGGSGALGLEAMSRGASGAVFVERSGVIRKVLEANIATLGYQKSSRVIPGDALRALRRLGGEKERFDIAFVDPPYASDLAQRAVEELAAGDLMTPLAIIVVEHAGSMIIHCPKSLQVSTTKRYGDTAITYLRQTESA